jgi:hypothetical protein
VQETLVESDPEAGTVLDDAAADPLEASLDRGDGVRGREQLLDVGFTQIEGHEGGIV